MINEVTLIGHVGNAPEVKDLGTNKVAKMSLATSRSYKKSEEWHQEVQWHNIEGWNGVAEAMVRCEKGEKVYVSGSIVYDKYEKDGKTMTFTKIRANSVKRLIRSGGSSNENSNENSNEKSNESFTQSGDLPF